MKILISAYSCDPLKGTEPGNGWNWALNYASLNHETWCLTTPEGKDGIEKLLNNIDYKNIRFIYVSATSLIDYLRFNFYPRFTKLHYLIWQHNAYLEALRLNKVENFDLVHHVTYGSLQLGSKMWKLNVPFIFGPVGGGQFSPKRFKRYFGKDWKKEKIREIGNYFTLNIYPRSINTVKNASLMLVTNHETYSLAEKHGAKSIEFYLDSGLPDDFFPEYIPEKQNDGVLKLLWVGKMIPRKGLLLLLEAFAKVDRNLSIKLTLVGGGPLWDDIQQSIKSLDLEDKVECTGMVPYEDVKKYLSNHDVFAFTSLRDSFGSQLLEATAYGLPIICLDHQGAHSFVPPNAGIKIPITNVEECKKQIASAIVYMFNHPEERKKFAVNAFYFARKQSWNNKIKHLFKLYDDLTVLNKKNHEMTP